MSSSSIFPCIQDIWGWTFTKEATAPCFIRDVLSMKETNVKDADFYWLGYVPCRTVLIVGIVVGIQDYEKRTLYTIDDSTAVIDCMLRHPAAPKAPTTDANRSLQKPRPRLYTTYNKSLPSPPPTPVTAIGYPVQVIGKVTHFHDTRQIIAESIACETDSQELRTCQAGNLPATTSRSASSNRALTSKTNIPAPHTPLKRPLHPPSSPLTDTTTSAPSSPVKPGSTEPPRLRHPLRLHTRDLTENTFRLYLKHYMDHAPVASSSDTREVDVDDDPFTTPTKHPRIHFCDQTPKARSAYPTNDQTPRASIPTGISSGTTSATSGFTLSHLRRVPELALLAGRVVHAETKRRVRAEREAQKTKAVQSSKPKTVSHAIKPADAPRVKIKRLFSWAVVKLYEEGSIVLWSGPVRPLPVPIPVPLQPLSSSDTSTSGLWKTANNTASFSTANGSLLSSANSTMFSSTFVSSSKFVVSAEDGYLSDPPPYEEEEAYVSVTPALLAGPVREAMRAKGLRAKSAKMGAEEITRCLRRVDERWARVGAWAVEEAMEIVLAEWK
ncbi:hypothetical protein AZE42_07002 [Rhizopogon vesiculosus]|uniref:CST complex subunit STN1 n=1 Tax=Rhizopogon vesiculosus TaxID=180088 RepID=A0A1J8Q7A4_9AGAM|nr:hypothetical protein AZE42_07002 [Rhizopogon vesiculosus]